MMLIMMARLPSTRTMLVCGGAAVAHVRHVADVNHRAVHRPDGQIVQLRPRSMGAELVSMAYSNRSIFIVPEGTIRFCAETAFTTSAGESPLACSACGSISTWIWRCLPP